MDDEIRLGLLNLHDAFLNAALVAREKWHASIDPDRAKFHISDHGRFERMWVTFLCVLVESWTSPQMRPVRDYIGSVVYLDELRGLLRAGERDGSLAKMRETRNYMCHRDRKGYWDDGRRAVIGQLDYHMKLHEAFSRVLLTAVKASRQI